MNKVIRDFWGRYVEEEHRQRELANRWRFGRFDEEPGEVAPADLRSDDDHLEIPE